MNRYHGNKTNMNSQLSVLQFRLAQRSTTNLHSATTTATGPAEGGNKNAFNKTTISPLYTHCAIDRSATFNGGIEGPYSTKGNRFGKYDIAVLGPGELIRRGNLYAMTGHWKPTEAKQADYQCMTLITHMLSNECM